MENLYIIKNKNGIKVYISNIGAGIFDITLSINNKDKSILLHPKDVNDYYYSNQYFGKNCGRTAGRITDSSFYLNGKEYRIENELPYDALHGGKDNLSFKEFTPTSITDNKITLFYLSKDKESGYPGDLSLYIHYEILDNDTLLITHEYSSTMDTLCNLTSHMYFNLNNDQKNNILDEYVYINADHYGLLNKDNVPIILNKVNQAFDFRKEHKIKDYIYKKEVQRNLGYNHPYIIKHDKDIDASLYDKSSSIR